MAKITYGYRGKDGKMHHDHQEEFNGSINEIPDLIKKYGTEVRYCVIKIGNIALIFDVTRKDLTLKPTQR